MKWMLTTLMTGLMIGNLGCGRSDDLKVDPLDASVPAPDVPADAPVLAEVYPALSGGALRLARLTQLPSGTLLHAEGISITERDLEDELALAPPYMREQLRENALLLVEQMATHDLLVAQARRSIGNDPPDEDRLLQHFFDEMTGKATVTDAEIKAFYEENPTMVGDIPFERVKPQIRQHLLQEKQQHMVDAYVRGLGGETVIAVSAPWVETQSVLVLDNPLDKARASGMPTFASFGADSCMPCQMMSPTREAIHEKYGEQVNVVYVHVNQDQMLSSRYGVRAIPHLMFFGADGEKVHEQTGMMSEDQIEVWLQRLGVTL